MKIVFKWRSKSGGWWVEDTKGLNDEPAFIYKWWENFSIHEVRRWLFP